MEDYSSFQETFTGVLHKHAVIKKNILRHNSNPYMNKNLKESNYAQVKNVKNRTQKNLNSNKKQRSFCVNLLRKRKKHYFNRKFWKTIKPHFSNEELISNKLLLIKKIN